MAIPQLTDEQRAAYGNRTFDRALYIYRAKITAPVAFSYANEVHRTGESVRKETTWAVLAPSREWADFAFNDRFAGEFTNVDPEIIKVEMFPVCAEITGLVHK